MDRLILGPDLLKDLENMVNMVKQNLKEAQDQQKNYVDKLYRDKDYKVGEHVYLKFKAKRITLRIGKCSKLAPRYCVPLEILAKIGLVVYQLALPTHIKVLDVFHVSLLKKYVYDAKHIIDWNLLQVELEGEFLPSGT